MLYATPTYQHRQRVEDDFLGPISFLAILPSTSVRVTPDRLRPMEDCKETDSDYTLQDAIRMGHNTLALLLLGCSSSFARIRQPT
jgi:hypothetical protein